MIAMEVRDDHIKDGRHIKREPRLLARLADRTVNGIRAVDEHMTPRTEHHGGTAIVLRGEGIPTAGNDDSQRHKLETMRPKAGTRPGGAWIRGSAFA